MEFHAAPANIVRPGLSASVSVRETGGLVPIQAFLGAIGKPVAFPVAESFSDFGVASLWHITDIENVPGILRFGLLSHRRAHSGYQPIDISDPEVQRRRQRIEPCYGRMLHDYAPTYINVRNPMLYKRQELQWRLCLLEIDPRVLESCNFVFTDRNAATRTARFFSRLADLPELPWDVLRAPAWSSYTNGRQQRCAEVLVPDAIPSRFINRVWAYDKDAVRWLATRGCVAGVDATHFFRAPGSGKAWH